MSIKHNYAQLTILLTVMILSSLSAAGATIVEFPIPAAVFIGGLLAPPVASLAGRFVYDRTGNQVAGILCQVASKGHWSLNNPGTRDEAVESASIQNIRAWWLVNVVIVTIVVTVVRLF